jgi:hypothetical protein
MEIDNLKEKLDIEINKLVVNKWLFLNNEWPLIANKFNHRTELKNIKTDISIIKDILLKQLGYIPVFYFLSVLYSNIEYPGPYHELDKGLLLLYHIVSGKSGIDMSEFMPYTTFYDLYKKFWITETNVKRLNKIIKKDMNELFSNLKIRLLSSKINNPDGFKNVTLLIDGHDSKIKYYNPDVARQTLYSHKFKKPGLRTQTVNDANNIVLFVSNSERCALGNDGSMFIKMNLQKKMHIADCVAADGGYTLFINKFKEISSNEGYDFSDKNFSCPIRKETGVKLTSTELTYNNKFGAFRSGNESIYSVLASKFDRFNNNTASLQITKIDTYNLQYRTAILLYNIWKFVDFAKIEAQPHHMLWYNNNFDFPTKTNRINYIFLNEAQNDKNYNDMIDLQEKYMNIELDKNDMEVDISSDEEEKEELSHKKAKKKNNIFQEPVIIIR